MVTGIESKTWSESVSLTSITAYQLALKAGLNSSFGKSLQQDRQRLLSQMAAFAMTRSSGLIDEHNWADVCISSHKWVMSFYLCQEDTPPNLIQ